MPFELLDEQEDNSKIYQTSYKSKQHAKWEIRPSN